MSVMPALVLVAMWASPEPVLGLGHTVCGAVGQKSADEVATSASFVVGTRSTIEGQNNILCDDDAPPVDTAGSFQWVALQNAKPEWNIGVNIVQIGYGRCQGTNNGFPIGINCNGQNYYYWAWGAWCGSGPIKGSLDGAGPVPLRIGPALPATAPTKDYYVLRVNRSGVFYYEGYVNGVLLEGLDANGNNRKAQVPASEVCWNTTSDGRQLAWFGEVFNIGDSMGGWVGATRNHLDYDPMRYSFNTGWQIPSLPFFQPCNAGTGPPFSCTIAERDHIYLDSH